MQIHNYCLVFALSVILLVLISPALMAETESTGGNGTAKQGKIPIGVDGFPAQDTPENWAQADDMQLDFAKALFPWIENKEGTYHWPDSYAKDEFKQYTIKLRERGYKFHMVEGTVHMDHKHLPRIMEGKRFNDPKLLSRWEYYLTAFLARYGDDIDFFSIGNEVGSYFGDKPDEWSDYIEFFKRGAEIIRELRPEIKIGIVLAEEDLERYWSDVGNDCDFLGFNYYTPCSAFVKSPTAAALDPDHPKYFAETLENAMRIAGEKPILISEIGCATHPTIDSSPELQAQFIKLLFQWLRGKENKILAMSWLSGEDWPYEGTKLALKGQLGDSLLELEPFMRYLTSLGLQYEDGTKKPGYDVFKEELSRYRSD